MKVTVVSYTILIVLLYFASNLYVQKKDIREFGIAKEKLNSFFSKQDKFINATNYKINVAYEQTSIPKYIPAHSVSDNQSELGSVLEQINNVKKEEYDKRWGDVYKVYNLVPRFKSKSESIINQDYEWPGWCLNIIERNTPQSFCEYMVYPFQVAYKKQKNTRNYNNLPTIQEAIDNAFEFYTENDKSSYKNFLVQDNVKGLNIAYKMDLMNYERYYILFSYNQETELFKRLADSLITVIGARKSLRKYIQYSMINDRIDKSDDSYIGWMGNDIYKVNNQYQIVGYWDLVYNFWRDPMKKDRNHILIWGFSILTILLLSINIPIIAKEKKYKQFREQSLRDVLLYECNPKRYTKPYDENKIASAIELYDRIKSADPNDIVLLKQIRKEVSEKLGVNFIDSELIKELLKKTDPALYAEPYDANKIKIANQLHCRLRAGVNDIDEIEEIQIKINEYLRKS